MKRRFRLQDLPETLPLFPLPGALLLPRSRLPLNIFEPRYLTMIDDAMKTEHRLIGMVQPLGKYPLQAAGKVQRIGCAGRLTRLIETDDNRYLVTLTGISRFRVINELQGFQPYATAEVSWPSFERDLGSVEADSEFDRNQFLAVLERYFQSSKLAPDWDSLKLADEELLINSLSMLCPFAPEEKQALLEAPSLANRRETLQTLMEFSLLHAGKSGPMQ
jgi:uncharacterized protein